MQQNYAVKRFFLNLKNSYCLMLTIAIFYRNSHFSDLIRNLNNKSYFFFIVIIKYSMKKRIAIFNVLNHFFIVSIDCKSIRLIKNTVF